MSEKLSALEKAETTVNKIRVIVDRYEKMAAQLAALERENGQLRQELEEIKAENKNLLCDLNATRQLLEDTDSVLQRVLLNPFSESGEQTLQEKSNILMNLLKG